MSFVKPAGVRIPKFFGSSSRLMSNDEPGAPRVFHNSCTLSEHGVITMPYLKNLDQIDSDRFTLVGLPLKLIGAEASPIRAVALL